MSKKLNYDELYKKYRHLVFQVALNYSSANEALAEDIMQETFMTVYLNIDTMKPTNMASYLITITKHKTLNVMKHEKFTVVQSAIDQPDRVLSEVEDVETVYLNEEATDEKRYLCEAILEAMGEKNPRWERAMRQRYIENRKREDIAKDMDISVKALDTLLHRAKKWAKKYFEVIFKETCRD